MKKIFQKKKVEPVKTEETKDVAPKETPPVATEETEDVSDEAMEEVPTTEEVTPGEEEEIEIPQQILDIFGNQEQRIQSLEAGFFRLRNI